MAQLRIERSGGFAGAREKIEIDNLDIDDPRAQVEAFRSTPQAHSLSREHRDQLRSARTQLTHDPSGAGGHPNGADRYMWTIQTDDAARPLTFHDPVSNAAAQTITAVASQLFAVS